LGLTRGGWARRTVRRRLETLLQHTTLSRAEIADLAEQTIARQYAAGELIVRRGVRGDFWGQVTRGEVAATTPLAERTGELAPVPALAPIVLRRGSTFGEAMFVEGQPSSQTLRALTDTEVAILPRASLLALARRRRTMPAEALSRRQSWPVTAALLGTMLLSIVGITFRVLVARNAEDEQRGNTGAADGLAVDSVQILSPPNGQVVPRSAAVHVAAELADPYLVRAELSVDGIELGQQARPQFLSATWTVEWTWNQTSEGTHVFSVQADRSDGTGVTSTPVTVTVVPDGRLLFASNRDGDPAIYSMETDGDDVRRLTAGPGEAHQPAWSRAGSLAYVVETGSGPAAIRWMPAGTDQASGLVAGRDPSWSWTGDQLAYAAGVSAVSQVFTTVVPGGVPLQVTSEAAYAGQPAWSHDGRSLAYVAERGGNLDVWSVDLGSGQSRRLTDDPGMDWAPAWSPDGSGVAFVSNRGGTPQIYLMKTDGTRVQRLTTLLQGAESPAWSPDGHWLAFVAYTGNGVGVNAREIYLMRADGRDQARLTENAADDTHPVWSR